MHNTPPIHSKVAQSPLIKPDEKKNVIVDNIVSNLDPIQEVSNDKKKLDAMIL